MQFVARKRRSAPAIIIVSLIDVLLVVLIFLMVTTSFKKQAAVKVRLPTSQQLKEGPPENPSQKNPYIITIAKDPPYIQVETGAVTFDRLQKLMTEQVAKNPAVVVAIRGDTEAHLGEVLKVIEAAKAAKVRDTPSIFVLPEQKK